VVAAFGFYHLLAPCKSPGGAHGHHHCLGAGVGEAHLLHRPHPADDALGELGLRLAWGWKDGPEGCLSAHRLVYGRHRVTVDRGRVVVEQVHELVAVYIPDAAAETVRDRERVRKEVS
jgi:hypothetical protein